LEHKHWSSTHEIKSLPHVGNDVDHFPSSLQVIIVVVVLLLIRKRLFRFLNRIWAYLKDVIAHFLGFKIPLLKAVGKLIPKEKLPAKERSEIYPRLKSVFPQFNKLCEHGSGYFTRSKYIRWKKIADDIAQTDLPNLKKYSLDEELKMSIDDFKRRFINAEQIRNGRNDAYISKEVELEKDFFDDVKPFPLDVDQRKAVVCDEDHTLILAGAGSGKTAVIAAKVGYLVKLKKVKEEQILLLTFSVSGSVEMQKRVEKMCGKNKVDIRTIHSLGREIMRRVKGRPPIVLESDDRKVASRNSQTYLIDQVFEELYEKNTAFQDGVLRYFSAYMKPYLPDYEFKTEQEWRDYLGDLGGIYTFSGDKVKSLEEKQICDFLYRNGIKFEYEKPYEHDTATLNKRQYLPDFYLSEYGIYYEHFGVDRDGNSPSWWEPEARKAYKEWMEWKKNLHKENGTPLICTYSHQKSEGILEAELTKQLLERGVKFTKKPVHLADLKKRADLTQFVLLLERFINLYKSCGKDLEQIHLEVSADNSRQGYRNAAFFRVFQKFFDAYEAEKVKKEKIDFGDMVVESYRAVEDEFERLQLKYRYIIVDEFQDTSGSAFRLIKAIKNRIEDCRLYVVGDDWQAIYGFAGSEMGIIKDFENRFDGTRVMEIGTNYRSLPNVVDLGKIFILKNPYQRRKEVRSYLREKKRNTVITSYSPKAIVAYFEKVFAGVESVRTVFVLGRYRRDKPEFFDDLIKAIPKVKWEYMTIHQSKGLEADYVVIVPPKQWGFPSLIQDERILDLVRPEKESFEYAEERRLMYVAITRAKKQIFFVKAQRREGKAYKTFVPEIEKYSATIK
jgi:DNA helicase-4